MLRNTFVHLPGIGEITERKLWRLGIRTWDDFIRAGHEDLPRGLRAESIREAVHRSIEQYEAGNWKFFNEQLPCKHGWRVYDDFPDRALYLDIETSGFGNEITVIGLYDGREARCFVEGDNLDAALEVMESYPVIVTFNGILFDMPVIRSRFPYNLFNHIHIDLMYPLRSLGFRGGLKRIEEQLGLVRSADTNGLSGWDAVRLWRAYRAGNRDALDLLIRYNEEDIRNLKPLMERVVRELTRKLDETE